MRTLKDILESEGIDSMIANDLRNCARDWVRFLEESLDPIKHYVTDTERIQKEAQIEWIKYFYNLEEQQ